MEPLRMKRPLNPTKTAYGCIIIRCAFGLIVLLGCMFCFFSTKEHYPAESGLVYENCTFAGYTIDYDIEKKGRKNPQNKYYLISVEEYEDPLIIDMLVFRKVNREILDSIPAGDTVIVAINRTNDKQKLYMMSYHGEDVLNYAVFVKRNYMNYTVIAIMMSVCAVGLLFGIVFSVLRCRYLLKKYPNLRF